MKKSIRSNQFLLCLMILLCACTSSPGKVVITGAWARPADSGANSAAYFEIEGSAQGVVLQSVSSKVAEKTELHRTIIDAEGNARLEHQESVEIIGGENISFAPGGYHVMFINLHEPLKVGDIFNLTLNFEKAGEVNIDVAVQTP